MARVLLIDDDQSSLDYMQQAMRMEGHEFAWAMDGEKGLEMVKQFHPELIICDVVMPHLGGYAVLETVRADPLTSQVPVLLFSAYMNEEARAIALQHGATEVLAKPFELEQLRGAMTRCLERQPR